MVWVLKTGHKRHFTCGCKGNWLWRPAEDGEARDGGGVARSGERSDGPWLSGGLSLGLGRRCGRWLI
ncbi:hypothetical protein FNV43_RR11685 [Rhamnella rubrinervis]|uniref:Uncharacterized protein n=1 Tax=Rhamnella rubrinervis TaxID=2594499 RepID=A0A8K0H600_9ROSA|nr:hypothetical protein FNV43_RR11685 [Rhamnella rubrinervis]